MERLTAKNWRNSPHLQIEPATQEEYDSQRLYIRLAELEDKLESGLLIELPCIEPFETCNMETGEPSICYNVLYRDKNSGELIIECEVYKSEAESLLEELRGE